MPDSTTTPAAGNAEVAAGGLSSDPEAGLGRAIGGGLADAVFDVLEAESVARQRLAGELHDHAVQLVVATQWQLQALARDLAPQARERVERAAAALAVAQQQLRAVMWRLDTRGRLEDGLAAAVHDSLQVFNEGREAAVPVSYEVGEAAGVAASCASLLLRVLDDVLGRLADVAVEAVHVTVREDPDESGALRMTVEVSTPWDGTGREGIDARSTRALVSAAGGTVERASHASAVVITCRLPVEDLRPRPS